VLNLLVALSLFIPLMLAGSPLPPQPGSQHPQIHAVSARWDFDWELREPIVFVTADITVDGTSAPVRGSVEFSSIYPHLVDDWRIARGFPPGALDEGQLARFEQYTRSVLGCGWDLPAAHVYDDPATHNPNSPLSIAAYADQLWNIIYCPAYGQDPPPPLGLTAPATDKDSRAASPPTAATLAQFRPRPRVLHPEIVATSYRWEYDYERREYILTALVDVVLDGRSRPMPGSLAFAAIYPYGLDDWRITRAFAPGPIDRRQLRQFERYTVAILACQYELPAAHVYDNPATHNSASPISIYAYAGWLWGLNDRIQCRGNDQTPPPPLAQ